MIPSNLAGVTCTTATGITYVVLFDEYAEHWAAGAEQLQANVIIDWSDRDEFLQDVVGWAQWDGASTLLNRHLPLACPLADGLWCDDAVLVKKGMTPGSGTPTFDVDNSNWPYFDWAMYKLTFIRLPWWVRSDTTLTTTYGGKEQFRFTETAIRYVPRLRKKPGQGFIYDATAAATSDAITGGTAPTPWLTGDLLIPVEEIGFSPDNQIEFSVKWKGIPANAIPWAAIDSALNHVNQTDFSIGLTPSDSYSSSPIFTSAVGTLAFSGLAAPISFYFDATGNQVADLLYTFTYQRGGWNYYRIAAMSSDANPHYLYAPMAVRNPSTNGPLINPGTGKATPPFPSYEFQNLFTPAAA